MVDQPSFRGTILAFLRRKRLFLLAFSTVCMVGGIYLLLKQPLYQSGASLVLHFDSQTVPNIDRTMTPPSQQQGSNEHREILYSDADILRSPDLTRGVIDTIGLARLYPQISATPNSAARKLELAVQAFASNFVVEVGVQSDVMNLSFLHPDPTLARDAVQQLLNQFYAQEAAVYSNPQLQFAEDEAKSSRNKLTAAQNALADFKSHHQIADLQQQISQLLLSRTDVEGKLGAARGRVLEAEQREAALKQLLDSVPVNVTSSAPGEQYRAADEAETHLDQLRAKRHELASTYLPGSDVFKQLDAQIASLSTAVRARTGEARGRTAYQPNPVNQSIRTDYLRAAAEATSAREPEQVLEQQLAQINARMGDLEAQRNQYDDLTRAVQIQNDTYRTMAIRYETARVEANRNAQRISAAVVIAVPVVPHVPARPRRKLVALATVVVALIAGVGSVLAVEGFDDRFRTPRDVTRILGVPVLATFSRDA
jgi:succinoglycan biosynthesis transport protein ExoP